MDSDEDSSEERADDQRKRLLLAELLSLPVTPTPRPENLDLFADAFSLSGPRTVH